MKKVIICLMSAGVLLMACSKGGNGSFTSECAGEAKSFATDVNPIIQASCTSSGCHNPGSNNGPGPLVTYQQIFNARSSIRAAVASGSMPQGSSLSVGQKNAIICWIDNGASNN